MFVDTPGPSAFLGAIFIQDRSGHKGLWLFLFVCEDRFHVAQAGLELAMLLKLALDN